MKKITLLFTLLLATISKAQIVDVYPFWVWDGSQNKTITLQVSALDINSNLQQKNIAWIDTVNFKLDALNNIQSSVNTNSVILGVDNNGNVDRLDVSSLPFKSSSYTPTLSISGNSLTAGGNTVTIPSSNDSQTLSVSGNSVSISNGNSILLPYSIISSSTAISVVNSGNNYTVTNTAPNPTITTSAYSAGAVYSFNTTMQKVDFGTTDPVITLPSSGTYLFLTNVKLAYNGILSATNRTITLKLRRTNNTASDISNSTTTFVTQVVSVSALTGTAGDCDIPGVIYTTSTSGDIVELWGNISSTTLLTGSMDVQEASIIAIKLY